MPGPEATFFSSFLGSLNWLSRHHLTARSTTPSGRVTPASKQARSPRAAYWVLELSPLSGPSFIFLTATCWSTLGLPSLARVTPGPAAPPPEATALGELGTLTSLVNSVGLP